MTKNDDFTKALEYYYSSYCSPDLYGKFAYLIGHYITGIMDVNEWENTIIPYLFKLKKGSGAINDVNSFEWGGTVCFRQNDVVILDESIFQIGRKLPGLNDDQGNQILNEEGEWLLDTIFIESHFSEFAKIKIEQFIFICEKWVDLLKDRHTSRSSLQK